MNFKRGGCYIVKHRTHFWWASLLLCSDDGTTMTVFSMMVLSLAALAVDNRASSLDKQVKGYTERLLMSVTCSIEV